MKLTNGAIKQALDAMAALCGGGNRLPTLAALRADRIRRALERAWEPCELHRQQLVRDHGEEKDGGHQVRPGMDTWPAFAAAFNTMVAEERELELETLTTADIEAGYYRDPETGRKDPVLDIAPAALGSLIALGIVVAPSTNGDGAHA